MAERWIQVRLKPENIADLERIAPGLPRWKQLKKVADLGVLLGIRKQLEEIDDMLKGKNKKKEGIPKW